MARELRTRTVRPGNQSGTVRPPGLPERAGNANSSFPRGRSWLVGSARGR